MSPLVCMTDDSFRSVLHAIEANDDGLKLMHIVACASPGCLTIVRSLLEDGIFLKTVRVHRQFKVEVADLLRAPSTVACRVIFMNAVDSDGTTNIGRILRYAQSCPQDVGVQYSICKLLWTSFVPQPCKIGSIHYEACETAGREGAVETLLHMLHAHPHEIKLHVTVCWALCFLVQCLESNRVRFLQTDGLEQLLAIEHRCCRPDVLMSAITVDNSSYEIYPEVIQEYLTRHSLMRGIHHVCNSITSQTRRRDDTVVWHLDEEKRIAAARLRVACI